MVEFEPEPETAPPVATAAAEVRVVLLTTATEEFAVVEGEELLTPVALATVPVVVGGKIPEAVLLMLVASLFLFETAGVAEIEAVAVAVAEAELEPEVPAVILNGNEYWKVEGSESRVNLNP